MGVCPPATLPRSKALDGPRPDTWSPSLWVGRRYPPVRSRTLGRHAGSDLTWYPTLKEPREIPVKFTCPPIQREVAARIYPGFPVAPPEICDGAPSTSPGSGIPGYPTVAYPAVERGWERSAATERYQRMVQRAALSSLAAIAVLAGILGAISLVDSRPDGDIAFEPPPLPLPGARGGVGGHWLLRRLHRHRLVVRHRRRQCSRRGP